MKIASVTLYCNEDFRLKQWINLYNEYKSEIYLHVIVNNGEEEDSEMLKSYFPDSIVLYSSSNNMTHSYNVGVQEIMKDKEVEAIMQITNDIRFLSGTITSLYERLMADSKLAVIGPVMLKRDSDIIESFGYIVPKYYSDAVALYREIPYKELNEDFKYVSFVPGGAIMVKRSAYDEFGYQDEKLHMYNDERDMFIRFDKLGYKEGVLCTAKAWHQHEFRPGSSMRTPIATYLTTRNRVYITSKYYNSFVTFFVGLRLFVLAFLRLLMHTFVRRDIREYDVANIKGVFHGYVLKCRDTSC